MQMPGSPDRSFASQTSSSGQTVGGNAMTSSCVRLTPFSTLLNLLIHTREVVSCEDFKAALKLNMGWIREQPQ